MHNAALRLLVLISLAAGMALQAHGQNFLPVYGKAYRLALKFKVDSARILTAQPLGTPDAEAQRLLVQSLADMIECMVRESDEPPSGYMARQNERIEALDDISNPSPWVRHALAECYLHRSICEGRYGHEARATLSAAKAYSKAKALFKDEPRFLPAQKAMGLYLVILGLMPVHGAWYMRLAGIKGDVDGGLAYLKACSTTPNAQQAEATLIYSMMQMYVRDQPDEGLAYLLRYVNNERDDLGGMTLLASGYREDHQQALALKTLNNIRQEPGHLPFYYPLLLKGDLYLQDLKPDSAIPFLEEYLQVCSRKRLVKSLHYKLFIGHYLKGDSLAANQHFFAIGQDGEVGTEADRYALYFYKRGLIPDKRLLRSRLLFDGGFDERALAALDSIEPSSLRTLNELTELCYRRARLAQRRKDSAAADRLFQLTVLTAGDDESYYAPMSCLQLGQMAVRQKRFSDARTWLERVKTYPKHEYKDGLDERADNWLKRLNKAERAAAKAARSKPVSP